MLSAVKQHASAIPYSYGSEKERCSSLEIAEARLGKDHPSVAATLSNLGSVLNDARTQWINTYWNPGRGGCCTGVTRDRAADLGLNSKDHAEIAAPQSQLRAEMATARVKDHLYILQRRPAVNSYTTVARQGCGQQWHVAFIPTRAVDATSACPALRWVGDLLGVAAQAYRILTRLHRRIPGSCTRTGTTAGYGTTVAAKEKPEDPDRFPPGEDQSCVQRPP